MCLTDTKKKNRVGGGVELGSENYLEQGKADE